MMLDCDFTVANTITIAVAIYKNNLKKFLKLSLAAHLWLLMPVYGWARYFAIAAWISKLSLQELNSSYDDAELKSYFCFKSLLVFLATGIVAIFVPALLSLLILVCIIVLSLFIERIIPLAIQEPIVEYFSSLDSSILEFLLGLSVIIFLPTVSAYFYARLFVSDLIFVDRSKKYSINLLGKSYMLTKNRAWKTFRTILQSFAIVIPIWSLAYILVSFGAGIILFSASYENFENVESDPFVIFALILTIFYSSNILTMPLWQSIKTTTYYDLSKKDSWDLKANHKR